MDAVLSRSNDPTLIAQARDPRAFDGVLKLSDGTAFGPRWVVTPQGVQVGFLACGGCDFAVQPDRSVQFGGPGGSLHDASIVSLEELFDPARLNPEYERKGWSPPGVTKGAVPEADKLCAIVPVDAALIDQAQVGLVDQRGRLEGVSRTLPTQVCRRDPAQLVVDDRRQVLARLLVAFPPIQKQTRGGVGSWQFHSRDLPGAGPMLPQ